MSRVSLAALRRRAGQFLQAHRIDAGLSIRSVGIRGEISRQTIYNWETEGPPLDDETLARVEEAYRIEPGSLVAALMVTGDESLDYWRGQVDLARGLAVDLAAKLADISESMKPAAAVVLPKSQSLRLDDYVAPVHEPPHQAPPDEIAQGE